MPKSIVETSTITEAAAASVKKSGRMLMQFLSPGWGSSGYYSTEIVEQAVTDKVIPAGTHMYADHPTETEDLERPVRSIKDLMAVTVEDAYLSPDGAMVGEVQVVPQWRDLVETVKDVIGVSIRGSATDIVEGTAEGRKGGIIEGLVAPVMSVDFVTRAGRGGKVLQVLESAAANRRAIAHGISEATVNDTREALTQVLRDAYSGEKTYVWIRDFDDSTVWFEVESPDDTGIFAQDYTQDAAGVVALTGERAEVRIVTQFVPVNPAGQPTTQESKEDTMPQIEEARLRELEEAHGRVPTLETERDTAIRERNEARATIPALTKARSLVTEANKDLPSAAVDRIVTQATVEIPLTEAGVLDEEALTKAVETARTAEETYLAGLAESAGAGVITGFGAAAGTQVEESTKTTTTPWGRPIKQEA